MQPVSDKGGVQGNSSALDRTGDAGLENHQRAEAPAAGAATPAMVQKSIGVAFPKPKDTPLTDAPLAATEAADAVNDTSPGGNIPAEMTGSDTGNSPAASEPTVVVRGATSSLANTGLSTINTSEVDSLILQASQGDPAAQAELAEKYFNGDGIEEDLEQAVYWYKKAAEQGDIDAQTSLSGMYRKGTGVTQDLKWAAYWCAKAAEQNDRYSQSFLGFLYETGSGVEQNFEQAAYWNLRSCMKSVADPSRKNFKCRFEGEEVLKCLPEVLKKHPEFHGPKKLEFIPFKFSQPTFEMLDQLIRFDPSIESLIISNDENYEAEQASPLIERLINSLREQNTRLITLKFDNIDEALQIQLDQLLAQNKVIGELRSHVSKTPFKKSDDLPIEVLALAVDKLIVHRIRSGENKATTQAVVDEFLMKTS